MLLTLIMLGKKVRPGFGTIAVVAVLCATPFMPASFWERMASIVDDKKDKQEFTGTREARWTVMKEGVQAFAEYPLTGIGAGQFQNYNPPGRKEAWKETHNAPIQVAAETGIFGLAAFLFLVASAGVGARTSRRLLERGTGRGQLDRLAAVMPTDDRLAMRSHSVAMTAGLLGLVRLLAFRVRRLQLDLLLPAGAHRREPRDGAGSPACGACPQFRTWEIRFRTSHRARPDRRSRGRLISIKRPCLSTDSRTVPALSLL